jgi:hypothetical protein
MVMLVVAEAEAFVVALAEQLHPGKVLLEVPM